MVLPVALTLALLAGAVEAQPDADFVGPRAPRPAPTIAARPVSLRAAVDVLLARKLPPLLRDERRRLTRGSGWLGIGAHRPVGADAGFGAKLPPLYLFPRAGLGQSLNVDPLTGRRY